MIDETGEKAEPFHGNKLYQQRAREALPLLVRQAKAQKTIYYSDLAEELGMPNPRNLNFVLGSVGKTLIQLSNEWDEEIPPIQCIVVNRTDGMPGEGVIFFIRKEEFDGMSLLQRRNLVQAQLQKVFNYTQWDRVLEAFAMNPAPPSVSRSANAVVRNGWGGGESECHKQLKLLVASHPELVGLPKRVGKGETEYLLPSGDRVDVLFRWKGEWIAVEVKSRISGDEDLLRGLYQCVKYQAVLDAHLLSNNEVPNVRTVLLCERDFPTSLIPVRNVLGLEVATFNPLVNVV